MYLTPYTPAPAGYWWAPSPYGYPYYNWYSPPYGYGWVPMWQPCEEEYGVPGPVMLVPQDEMVDAASSPKELFVGGLREARLTLEYMPVTGATSAAVKITITGADGTSTWEETPVAEGFHVKRDFSTVATGSTITVEVTEVIARLRWCEVISC